jgi:hypothetical protein
MRSAADVAALTRELDRVVEDLGDVTELVYRKLRDLQRALEFAGREKKLANLYRTLIGEERHLYSILRQNLSTAKQRDAQNAFKQASELSEADKEAVLQKSIAYSDMGPAMRNRAEIRKVFRRLFSSHWTLWSLARPPQLHNYPREVQEPLKTIADALEDARWLMHVFVCYSKRDRGAVNNFLKLAREAVADTPIEFWQDENLFKQKGVPAGKKFWRESIEPTLLELDASLLFLSSNFLERSPTVNNHEMPSLVEQRERDMRLVPIVLCNDWRKAVSPKWWRQAEAGEWNYVPKKLDFKTLLAKGRHQKLITDLGGILKEVFGLTSEPEPKPTTLVISARSTTRARQPQAPPRRTAVAKRRDTLRRLSL